MLQEAGRYQLESEARERDAFGILYSGTDRESGDPVYLKLLRAPRRAAPSERREPYEGLLHEDLILPLEEMEIGGERAVVVPRPEGELLAECLPRLRRGGLTGRHALLRVLTDAARGLDQIHRIGLVHGQVSPASIQVRCTAPLQSFLLCFGPPVPRAGHQYLTDNPNLAYVSREQLRGGGDRASDIYALGMLLYAAFGKSPAFPDDSPYDMAERILRGECEPFEPNLDDIHPSLHAAIRPEIETIGSVAMKALQRDPRARYATMGELARVLEGLVARLSPIELGIGLYRAGRYDQAALILEDAAEGPDAARAWVFLGKACSEGLGDYERGLVAFRRATRENPDLVIAREELIDHYARFGHLKMARHEMLELLASDPEDILLMMRYGQLLRRGGDGDAAVDVYRRVIALNPYHLPAYARAILLELDRGRMESAEAFCVAALETMQKVIGLGNLDPADVAGIYWLRARLMQQKGLAPRAILWAERALAAYPAHEESHSLLAELYLQGGDPDKAIAHLLAALSLAPNKEKILERLARLMDHAEPPSS